jgi:cytochrome c biogenesis factor
VLLLLFGVLPCRPCVFCFCRRVARSKSKAALLSVLLCVLFALLLLLLLLSFPVCRFPRVRFSEKGGHLYTARAG